MPVQGPRETKVNQKDKILAHGSSHSNGDTDYWERVTTLTNNKIVTENKKCYEGVIETLEIIFTYIALTTCQAL